jgi:hypothetical protein
MRMPPQIMYTTSDNFAPTASEVAAVEAEVSDTAFIKAINSIKKTASSGRHVRPSEG